MSIQFEFQLGLRVEITHNLQTSLSPNICLHKHLAAADTTQEIS